MVWSLNELIVHLQGNQEAAPKDSHATASLIASSRVSAPQTVNVTVQNGAPRQNLQGDSAYHAYGVTSTYAASMPTQMQHHHNIASIVRIVLVSRAMGVPTLHPQALRSPQWAASPRMSWPCLVDQMPRHILRLPVFSRSVCIGQRLFSWRNVKWFSEMASICRLQHGLTIATW